MYQITREYHIAHAPARQTVQIPVFKFPGVITKLSWYMYVHVHKRIAKCTSYNYFRIFRTFQIYWQLLLARIPEIGLCKRGSHKLSEHMVTCIFLYIYLFIYLFACLLAFIYTFSQGNWIFIANKQQTVYGAFLLVFRYDIAYYREILCRRSGLIC